VDGETGTDVRIKTTGRVFQIVELLVEAGLSSTEVASAVRYRFTPAAGTAIIAHHPRERVEAIVESKGLEKLTQHTVPDPNELSEELRKIRQTSPVGPLLPLVHTVWSITRTV